MMKFRSMLLAVAISTAFGATAHAEEWRRIWGENGLEVAVDVDSFSGPSGARTAQVVMVSENGHVVMDHRIDCGARTISTVYASIFGPDGALKEEREIPAAATAKPLREDDGTALLASGTCEGAEIVGPGFASPESFAASVRAGSGG